MPRRWTSTAWVLAGAWALAAPPTAGAAEADVGGYARIMTRPDFQGGDGKLGYWNLYGRLLNEGPWATLDLQLALLEHEPGSPAPWTRVHARVEGGSIGAADGEDGALDAFRLSQLYVEAGNVLLRDVTWQVGTLWTWFGDLGLYDMRPTELFQDTVGASATWRRGPAEVLLAVGDAGWSLKGEAYDTVFTGGGTARLRLGRHLELGAGGQARYEPAVPGNRNAPHVTPGIDYEDFLRGEVVASWEDEHPGQLADFPDPEPVSARSGKVVGYLGFGDLGPLAWNNLYLAWELLHPQATATEEYAGETWTLYVTELTDERTTLQVGDELRLALGRRLEVAWAAYYARRRDGDNTIAPSDQVMDLASTVLRGQLALTPTVHLLAETSLAREHSPNGNRYRLHADSIFESSDGRADTRGLEYGDSDTRDTWQGKGGLVLNPLGPGIYTRPSLRLLYGVQYSTQNNAFGNSFVETVDEYNAFGNVERHWHHVVAIETEAWF